MAAAPFHFYAPDVYQGTTSINAGILAVVPKLAGLIALIRFTLALPPDQFALAWQLLVVLSLVTMTVGNVSALWQTNVRRLLAFSSIAHSGYMLIGVAVALAAARQGDSASGGVAAALFYVVVYALASFGSFAALAWLGASDRDVNELDELSGLSRSQPLAAAALAVFLFSLAGIPPLAGFWGKLALFGSAVRLASGDPSTATWFVVLAIAGALNAAIAAAYYLRFIAALYFYDEPAEPAPARGGGGAMAATLVALALVLLTGFFPNLLAGQTQRSEAGAMQTSARRRPAVQAAASPTSEKLPAVATNPPPAEVESRK
jgi:NADH-quinone oxidoreductase subunit N